MDVPTLLTCHDAEIEGTLEKTWRPFLRWSKNEYLTTDKDDTLATVAHRLAVWGEFPNRLTPHGWKLHEETPSPELLAQRSEILKLVVGHLRELNPHLPANENEKLPEGTRIIIREN